MTDTETTEKITATYEIPVFNMESAEKKLKRLVRRSEKLGVGGFGYEVSEARIAKRDMGRDFHGKKIVAEMEVCDVTVTGDAPKLAGWVFAATIEHEAAGNIIRRVPGVELEAPVSFRSVDRKCDHCRTARGRKDTYLVFNEERGEWKQVGKKCLENFLGCDVSSFLSILECWSTLGSLGDLDPEEFFSYGRGEIAYRLLDLLTYVNLVVRLEGWVSRTTARDGLACASVDTATWVMSPSLTEKEARAKAKYTDKMTNADSEFAAAAVKWVKADWGSKAFERRSEFEHNMLIAIDDEHCVSRRKTGIVASLIQCYRRHLSIVEERKAEREGLLNEHFGSLEPERKEITRGKNKGQFREKARRYELTLKIVKIIDIENDWGTTFIHKMRDDEGRSFTWFGSSRLYDGENSANEGGVVTATWGIKKHDEYKGTKQTVLTRPTAIKVVEKGEDDDE
jgi:hypothetical protein